MNKKHMIIAGVALLALGGLWYLGKTKKEADAKALADAATKSKADAVSKAADAVKTVAEAVTAKAV